MTLLRQFFYFLLIHSQSQPLESFDFQETYKLFIIRFLVVVTASSSVRNGFWVGVQILTVESRPDVALFRVRKFEQKS